MREHYPVSKLPEDLRQGLASDGEARVTVEEMIGSEGRDRRAHAMNWPAHVASLEELFCTAARATFASGREVDAYVRGSRDEWE